jgi:hypothetical protein
LLTLLNGPQEDPSAGPLAKNGTTKMLDIAIAKLQKNQNPKQAMNLQVSEVTENLIATGSSGVWVPGFLNLDACELDMICMTLEGSVGGCRCDAFQEL